MYSQYNTDTIANIFGNPMRELNKLVSSLHPEQADADMAEFDRIIERNALIDEEVNIELAVRMKDIQAIEDAVADNPDIVASIILKNKDVAEKLTESLKHWLTCDIERELGI